MFVLIWATLLFSMRVSDAETGSSVWGKTSCLKDYCITLVEGEITAEAGLCVVIPCFFTVPKNINISHIVWFKCEATEGRCGEKYMIFNSDPSSDKVQLEFKGRVSLLESDVSQKNCSIIINDLKESDSGAYQLRVEALPIQGSLTFSQRATVSVKGLSQRPTVMIPPLTEGQLTTLTCTAPGHCSGSEPTFTWRWRGRGESDADLTGNITAFKTENVTEFAKRRSSNLSFSPSAEHHGTNITCTVLFQGNVSTEETATLNVTYSPKHVTVQANPGLDVKENGSLTLSCSAESNPPVSSVTWRKTTDGREEIIQQTQNQTFRVNSASPSDSGLYSCEATNDIGSGKSQPAEVKVRFSPKHTNITESVEKQQPDGRSSVMLSCFSHSFPPVQHYSWYKKSQGEERMEIVSKHQNHTVYSNQPGVYYCIAQNEADHSLSDPVHLFESTGDYLENLRFLVFAPLLLMIIIVIVVNLRYWRKKSIQQGTTNNESPSGFSNEPESLQDYENISNAAARAPTSPNLLDDHTSEGEVELNFPQVRFTAMPRRQTTNRDSSSSHQDES